MNMRRVPAYCINTTLELDHSTVSSELSELKRTYSASYWHVGTFVNPYRAAEQRIRPTATSLSIFFKLYIELCQISIYNLSNFDVLRYYLLYSGYAPL